MRPLVVRGSKGTARKSSGQDERSEQGPISLSAGLINVRFHRENAQVKLSSSVIRIAMWFPKFLALVTGTSRSARGGLPASWPPLFLIKMNFVLEREKK